MEAPRPDRLPLIGNNLALDFANTASGRGGPHRLEHLVAPHHLLDWGGKAGLLTPRQRAAAAAQSAAALEWQLKEALALREAIHQTGTAIAAGRTAPGAALRRLAQSHRACLAEAEIVPARGRYAWRWPAGGTAALLGPITLAAVELLGQADPRRIRICRGEDCGWLFLDISKAGRRRWCEMGVCGNRAKAKRFAARRREMQDRVDLQT